MSSTIFNVFLIYPYGSTERALAEMQTSSPLCHLIVLDLLMRALSPFLLLEQIHTNVFHNVYLCAIMCEISQKEICTYDLTMMAIFCVCERD